MVERINVTKDFIKVSRPGVSVFTATDANLLFDSTKQSIMVLATGQAYLNPYVDMGASSGGHGKATTIYYDGSTIGTVPLLRVQRIGNGWVQPMCSYEHYYPASVNKGGGGTPSYAAGQQYGFGYYESFETGTTGPIFSKGAFNLYNFETGGFYVRWYIYQIPL